MRIDTAQTEGYSVNLYELRDIREHAFLTEPDGTILAMRIHSDRGSGITILTGMLKSDSTDQQRRELAAIDAANRMVVHFTDWDSVTRFYAETAYAPLVESMRTRVLRFSTFSSAVDQDDTSR